MFENLVIKMILYLNKWFCMRLKLIIINCFENKFKVGILFNFK